MNKSGLCETKFALWLSTNCLLVESFSDMQFIQPITRETNILQMLGSSLISATSVCLKWTENALSFLITCYLLVREMRISVMIIQYHCSMLSGYVKSVLTVRNKTEQMDLWVEFQATSSMTIG